jgi:hypothetical protein
MPKLKESPEEKQDKLFRGLVAKNMTLCGISHNNELAPKMHMHEQTFNYKMNAPDKFTRKELRRLFSVLKFTEEEKGSII